MRFFNNMKIAVKLNLLLFIILVVTIIVGFLGAGGIKNMNENVKGFSNASEFQSYVFALDKDFLDTELILERSLFGAEDDLEKAAKDLEDINADINKQMGKAESYAASNLDFSAIKTELDTVNDGYEKLSSYILAGKLDAGKDYYKDTYGPVLDKCLGKLDKLSEFAKKEANAGSSASLETGKKTQSKITYVALILAVFIVASALVLSFHILKPVRLLSNDVKAIKDGDLSVTPSSDRKDEVGLLIAGVGEMAEALRNYIGEIERRLSAIAAGDLTTENEVEFLGDFKTIEPVIAFMWK